MAYEYGEYGAGGCVLEAWVAPSARWTEGIKVPEGRFDVGEESNYYALEEPTSLNTLELLPQLVKMGVRAFKIEGRQRSPAYVEQVTRVWRAAIDAYQANPDAYSVKSEWDAQLARVSEGSQTTLGAYHRQWQ